MWQEFFVCRLQKLLGDIICSILFIILRVIIPDKYHHLLLGLRYMRYDFYFAYVTCMSLYCTMIILCIWHVVLFCNGCCSVFHYQFRYCSFDNLFFHNLFLFTFHDIALKAIFLFTVSWSRIGIYYLLLVKSYYETLTVFVLSGFTTLSNQNFYNMLFSISPFIQNMSQKYYRLLWSLP